MRLPIQGVSLIELLVAVTVMGILATTALPAYTTWIQNSRIRTAAEAILNGLQLARAEAVRRNAPVQFALASATSTGWTITVPSSGVTVQIRSAGEGSSNVTNINARNPAGTAATSVTFNGFGRVPNTADMSQINIDVPTTVLSAAASRDLRITISASGQARMCDPNLAIASNPLGC